MLLAGIIESDDKTANLIYNMLKSNNRKVDLFDTSKSYGAETESLREYVSHLSDNGTDILLIKINPDKVEIPFYGLKLDFIVYGDKECRNRLDSREWPPHIVEHLYTLLDENGIVIVNADNTELLKQLRGMKLNTVTYGFNSKASVTTSSTGEGIYKDSFLCCLQRTLPTREGRSIEPQEYKIKLTASEYDTYSLLAAATFAAINDIDLNQLIVHNFAKC